VSRPFQFCTRFNLTTLLGVKARNPAELLETLRTVPRSSIYYHTHRFLQQHHYLSPEPTNDFAYWLTNILNLKELGEAFACIDTVSFANLEQLRQTFVLILENDPALGNRAVNCPEGEEFHFMGCVTYIIPIPYTARDLREFAEILGKISIDSFYYHGFESRLLLGMGASDFQAWLESIGESALAKQIARMDPYTMTMDGLRKKTIKLVTRHVKH